MARQPMIRTANASLLGGASNPGPAADTSTALRRGGQAIASGLSDLSGSMDRIERNRAAQYIALNGPALEGRMNKLLAERAESITSESVDTFTESYRGDVDEMIDNAVEVAPPMAQDALRARLMSSSERFAAGALRIEAENAAKFQVQAFGEGADMAGANLVSDPGAFEMTLAEQEALIEQMTVPEARKQLLRDATRERLAVGALEGMMITQGKPQEVYDRLNAGEFDQYLDAGKKADMMARAQSILNRGQTDYRAQITGIVSDLKDDASFIEQAARDGVQTGQTPQAWLDQLDQLSRTFPELKPQLDRQVRDMENAARVVDASVAFRASSVEQMQDQLAEARQQDRAGRTRGSEFTVAAMESVYEQVQDRMENDPVRGLQEAGLIEQEELPPADADWPEFWSAMEPVMQVAREYYGQEVSPFSADSIERMQRRLETMPADRRAMELEQWATDMPEDMTDRVAEMFHNSDKPEYAMALAMARRSRTKLTAEIMTGLEVMTGDGYAVTTGKLYDSIRESDVMAVFESSPRAMQHLVQSAEAIYAARVPLSTLSDSNAEVDGELMENIMLELIGAEPVRSNQRMTLPPIDGMSQFEFDKAVYSIQPGDLTEFGIEEDPTTGKPMSLDLSSPGIPMAPAGAQPGVSGQVITPEVMRQYVQLVPAYEGVYYLEIGGKRIVGSKGGSFLFDFKSLIESPGFRDRKSPYALPVEPGRENPFASVAGSELIR